MEEAARQGIRMTAPTQPCSPAMRELVEAYSRAVYRDRPEPREAAKSALLSAIGAIERELDRDKARLAYCERNGALPLFGYNAVNGWFVVDVPDYFNSLYEAIDAGLALEASKSAAARAPGE